MTSTSLADFTYTAPPRTRCATPTCKRKPGHGLFENFCQPHAEQLAKWREELAVEIQTRGRYSMRRDQRVDLRGSTCCTVGCMETRKRWESYCLTCQAMGAIEEAA